MTDTLRRATPVAHVFPGETEMARRCRALDWGATPLGPVEEWSQSLRTAAALTLTSGFACILLWGPELVQIYNDPYIPFLGVKHPAGLGMRSRECWAEIDDITVPTYTRVFAGETVTLTAQPYLLERRGPGFPAEKVLITLSYAPVYDDDGVIAGTFVTLFDVTDGVRSQDALAESEAKYRALFDTMDQGFCVVEILVDDANHPTDYRFIDANRAFEGQTGLVGAVGRTARELVPGLEQHWIDMYGRIGLTGEPVRFEQGSDAMRRWFDVFAFRIGVPERRHVAILFSDVSAARTAARERDRLLATLATERDRLRQAFDQSPGFVAMLSGPEHRYDYVNTRHQQFSGHRPLLGRAVREAFPDITDQGFIEMLDRVYATGEPFAGRGMPIQFQHAPGGPLEDRRIDLICQPLTDLVVEESTGAASPQVTGILVQGRDVTETAIAEDALDLERRRLVALIEQLPVGVHVAEAPSGRLVLGNAAMRRIIGLAPLSQGIDDYSADYTAYHRTGPAAGRTIANDEWPLARTLATGETVIGEVIEVVRADSTRVLVSLSSSPVHDADGRLVGGVVVLTDVTEREQLLADRESALATAETERARAEEARAAAEAANEAKGQFLANMSHELRTPLNAIAGYVQLLDLELHGPVTVAQRDALSRVARAQQHLLGLINDVLNFAKLEAGQVEYEIESFDLRDALADAAPMVEPQRRAKGLDYDVEIPETECIVLADRDKTGQVLINLLSNAVKFTPSGRVTVRVSADAPPGDANTDTNTDPRADIRVHGDGHSMVRVEITDTGIGIPPDRYEAVFAPFVQVRAGVGRPAEGTGLGLAISRELARAMGGDLTVQSVVGGGSTFTLVLRRAPV